MERYRFGSLSKGVSLSSGDIHTIQQDAAKQLQILLIRKARQGEPALQMKSTSKVEVFIWTYLLYHISTAATWRNKLW